ncbi:MAG: DUF3530 family protein, partial [Gammaproteobacteria bacterium]|nr:DUF3530 family protein [Gammaproteobacteria bacterium]
TPAAGAPTAGTSAAGTSAAGAPAAGAPAAGTPPAGGGDALPPGREGEIASRLPRLTGEEEAVWLTAPSGRFVVLRRAPKRAQTLRGAIVLVPSAQAFIDQWALSRTLRELPVPGGYLTFALQVPLSPPAGASPPPAPTTITATGVDTSPITPSTPLCERLTATLALAVQAAPPLIALVAESGSADAALACFSTGLPADIKAFAAVGRWQGRLADLRVPSIEFIPGLDRQAQVLAARRASAPQPADAPPHRQVTMDGVDRYFQGAETELAQRLRGWLDHLPRPPPPPGRKPPLAS